MISISIHFYFREVMDPGQSDKLLGMFGGFITSMLGPKPQLGSSVIKVVFKHALSFSTRFYKL